MNTNQIMLVFGTRPEAIKMIPIIKALQRHKSLTPVVVVTGQHRELVNQILAQFKVVPDYNLDIMQARQTLTEITERTMRRLAPILEAVQPAMVLVHGDTTTTLAASLAAFYHQLPIGHVEAGLRTWNKYEPYPEEMNRQLTDVLADYYFAPTELAQQNLIQEHHPATKIKVTGNTAIDMLQYTLTDDWDHPVLKQLDGQKKVILLTMHRRENWGEPMERVFAGLNQFINDNPDFELVFPMHPNPLVRKLAQASFAQNDRVHLIEPLEVVDFHNLAARSWVVLTDSGGIQEEAPALRKPVLVLRDQTERPEGVTAGVLKLVGTTPEVINQTLVTLMQDSTFYHSFTTAQNPYGDGHAAERIVQFLALSLQG